MQSEQIGKLAEALAKTQAAMVAPTKGKTGKIKGTTKDGRAYEYEYKYADLADVIECRKVGAGHGLAITQGMEMREGYLALTTMLMHLSGEWKSWDCPIPAGLKPQELGSYLTYMRRYSECGAWGIAAEDDDDGKGAGDATTKAEKKPEPAKVEPPKQEAPKPSVLTNDEIVAVHSLAKKAGFKTPAALAPFLSKLCNVSKASELSKNELAAVMDALNSMAKVPA